MCRLDKGLSASVDLWKLTGDMVLRIVTSGSCHMGAWGERRFGDASLDGGTVRSLRCWVKARFVNESDSA
jgi:hypothetical protein